VDLKTLGILCRSTQCPNSGTILAIELYRFETFPTIMRYQPSTRQLSQALRPKSAASAEKRRIVRQRKFKSRSKNGGGTGATMDRSVPWLAIFQSFALLGIVTPLLAVLAWLTGYIGAQSTSLISLVAAAVGALFALARFIVNDRHVHGHSG
jgi:hypothetical protein